MRLLTVCYKAAAALPEHVSPHDRAAGIRLRPDILRNKNLSLFLPPPRFKARTMKKGRGLRDVGMQYATSK